MSVAFLNGADIEKIMRENAEKAAPAGTPDEYNLIWSQRYLSATEEAQKEAALPYTSIKMERTECYGTCPAYSVTFHRDGSAEYEAKAHLPKLGSFTGHIRITTFARLCYSLQRLGVFNLKPDYSANWTDDSRCTISVEGREKKVVSEYGGIGPIELWSAQMIIDQVKDEIEWTALSNKKSGR